MLRRDSTFRLSKQAKRTLATFTDKEQRNTFKEIMIKAQIDGSKVFATKKGKDTEDEG